MQRFIIPCRPAVALARYAQGEFARENDAHLRSLRSACAFVNPANYRGISRDPLDAMPHESLRSYLEREEEADLRTNAAARLKLLEMGVPASEEDTNDRSFLETRADAETVFALLDTPEDYEIVALSREADEITTQLLGYDVGYWGIDYFSIVCDTVVAPRWHPPNPDDFAEVADRVRVLNEHLLFRTYSDAVAFRAYYVTKVWAETEAYAGEFCVIAVGAV